MSSQSPFTRPPLDPPPYSPAGSSNSSPAYRGENVIIEPPFPSSIHGHRHGLTDADASRERDRTNLMNMDRKRRLTATANDDAINRRPSALPGPSSLPRSRLQQDRPLPMLPVDDDRTGYTRSSMPGSSRENAIDLTSSSSMPASTFHQHSRSLSTIPHRSRPDLVEYTLPRWQPDSEVTQCTICGSQFSFWYRKHHCRKCGRVVCAACSPHRITIPRQYIVRPPELVDRPASQTTSRHSRESSRESHSPAPEILETSTSTWTTNSSETNYINPALGGGEEVRLCNPCVPDPNPDPLLNYGAISWGTAVPGVPISQRFHQVRRSLSGAQIFSTHSDLEREANENRRRHEALQDFLGQSTSSAGSVEPIFGRNRPPHQQSARGQSYSFSSHNSGPVDFTSRDSLFVRPRRVHSMVDRERTLPTRPPPQVPVDERDICPICSSHLPPLGDNGNEDDREEHIRNCIARSSGADRSSPALNSPQSHHPLRMLSFTATEKDCLSEDATPEECTICMEEYEVGDKLARLECLCKFHKACIVGWFERKKECPVHKIS